MSTTHSPNRTGRPPGIPQVLARRYLAGEFLGLKYNTIAFEHGKDTTGDTLKNAVYRLRKKSTK